MPLLIGRIFDFVVPFNLITVNIDIHNKLTFSIYLKRHPLKNESVDIKSKYLSALVSFSTEYGLSDYSNALLQLYRTELLGNDFTDNLVSSKINSVIAYRFKDFRLKSHNSCFCFDCFFILAFNNRALGNSVLYRLKKKIHFWHYSKADSLYSLLYNRVGKVDCLPEDLYAFWNANVGFQKEFYLKNLVLATMSAGKSTLINALAGKKICKSQLMACTARIHYIYNKPIEDFYIAKLDGNLSLNVTDDKLLTDSADGVTDASVVSTFFNWSQDARSCFIDSPGVNSSMNKHHEGITKEFLKKGELFDQIICVIDATTIGTNDSNTFLNFIYEKANHKRVIFVLNKLDLYRCEDDSIEEAINSLRDDLKRCKFVNPLICPVFAMPALLLKKKIFGYELTKYEHRAIEDYRYVLNDPFYDLSKYYKEFTIEKALSFREGEVIKDKECVDLLYRTGLPYLEYLIFNR